eukprot:9479633-Pyramimonas_sp.AAC.1
MALLYAVMNHDAGAPRRRPPPGRGLKLEPARRVAVGREHRRHRGRGERRCDPRGRLGGRSARPRPEAEDRQRRQQASGEETSERRPEARRCRQKSRPGRARALEAPGPAPLQLALQQVQRGGRVAAAVAVTRPRQPRQPGSSRRRARRSPRSAMQADSGPERTESQNGRGRSEQHNVPGHTHHLPSSTIV